MQRPTWLTFPPPVEWRWKLQMLVVTLQWRCLPKRLARRLWLRHCPRCDRRASRSRFKTIPHEPHPATWKVCGSCVAWSWSTPHMTDPKTWA